jgi:hypothetical protein
VLEGGVEPQEVAHVILSQNVPEWHMGALVELALHMERKNFLAHRHCQSLMDLWWRGGYPGSFCLLSADQNAFSLCAYIVLPFLNPYLQMAEDHKDMKNVRTTAQLEDLLYGALAQALRLSSRERSAAKGSANLKMASTVARAKTANSVSSPDKPDALKHQSLFTVRTKSMNDMLEDSSEPKAEGAVHHLEGMDIVAQDASWVAARVRRAQTKGSMHLGTPRGARRIVLLNAELPVGAQPPSAFVSFYRVPLVKFWVRALWQLAFLALYAYELTHLLTADQLATLAAGDAGLSLPPLNPTEGLFIVWSLTLGLEQWHLHVSMRGFGLTATMPVQGIVQFAYALLALAIGVRLLSVAPVPSEYADVALPLQHSCYLLYQTLVSMDAVPISIELFNFMWPTLSFEPCCTTARHASAHHVVLPSPQVAVALFWCAHDHHGADAGRPLPLPRLLCSHLAGLQRCPSRPLRDLDASALRRADDHAVELAVGFQRRSCASARRVACRGHHPPHPPHPHHLRLHRLHPRRL